MLLSNLKSLFIALVPIVAASPLTVAAISQASSLPEALQHGIPLCAQTCLQASLVQKFPVACTNQDRIQCLCSHYGNTGVSLGEVALNCVYSSCSSNDANQNAASAYNVCFGQKDAVMPTQTALTIIASTALGTTSTISLSTTIATATTNTITLRSQTSPTQAASVDMVSIIPPPTSTSTSFSTISATASETAPRMSAAQIAGLSVAAVAAFILAVGLMALSICLRRRKERKAFQSPDEMDKGQRFNWQSARISHYVPVKSIPAPLAPALTELKKSKYDRPNISPPREHLVGQRRTPTKQKLGVGTLKGSSSSSLPIDQIGLAVTAELDGMSAASSKPFRTLPMPQELHTSQSSLAVTVRPISAMTRDTVFEEDALLVRRTSSILLPTPPAPIAPIRSLQPSRQRPPLNTSGRQIARRSELFLSIPTGYDRPQPKRIIAAEQLSNNMHNFPENSQRARLAPPIQMVASSSFESKATTASSREPSNNGDILDYYLATYQETTPQADHGQVMHPEESPKAIQIKPKKSLSIVSQTRSQASSNIRDSFSSQTSFETADPNDSTPEDEDDDKQLSDDNKYASPLEESPISNLTYPKIPRASNQLVPRSPRSPQNHKSPNQRQNSRKPFQPATLLQKRHHHLPPLLLETRPCLKNSKIRQPRSPPHMSRAHVRSISLESWNFTPASKVDRQSKAQSGFWGKGPMMYEEDVVRPLNVRRKAREDEMREMDAGKDVRFHSVASEGLKSPAWVPRLTPTKKGEDLFISVGWGDDSGM